MIWLIMQTLRQHQTINTRPTLLCPLTTERSVSYAVEVLMVLLIWVRICRHEMICWLGLLVLYWFVVFGVFSVLCCYAFNGFKSHTNNHHLSYVFIRWAFTGMS